MFVLIPTNLIPKFNILKDIISDRCYKHSNIDMALFFNYSFLVLHVPFNLLLLPILKLIYLIFPNPAFQLLKILKKYDFKIILTAANKLTLSKLKDLF